MDQSYRLQILFDKYLRSECTQAEVNELTELLKRAEADDELVEPMQALWQRLREDKTEYDVDWDRMYSRVQNAESDLFEINTRRKNNVHRLWPAIAAALIIFFAGVGGYWYINNDRSATKEQQLTTVASVDEKNVESRQTIYLPDGSTVILNEGSKLNYPAAFNGRIREVYLSGEGYFDIKHNPKLPFLVHSGKLIIKVLGTAFDIKAYPGDESIQVTVTRGKVQVMKGNEHLGYLVANQQLAFTNTTEVFEQKIVDTKSIVAWKPGEILLDDITMEEATQMIEKRFNVVVDFENPLIKNCRVSATFSEEDMMDEMLSVICSVSKANYTTNGNKILINGKGCK